MKRHPSFIFRTLAFTAIALAFAASEARAISAGAIAAGETTPANRGGNPRSGDGASAAGEEFRIRRNGRLCVIRSNLGGGDTVIDESYCKGEPTQDQAQIRQILFGLGSGDNTACLRTRVVLRGTGTFARPRNTPVITNSTVQVLYGMDQAPVTSESVRSPEKGQHCVLDLDREFRNRPSSLGPRHALYLDPADGGRAFGAGLFASGECRFVVTHQNRQRVGILRCHPNDTKNLDVLDDILNSYYSVEEDD